MNIDPGCVALYRQAEISAFTAACMVHRFGWAGPGREGPSAVAFISAFIPNPSRWEIAADLFTGGGV